MLQRTWTTTAAGRRVLQASTATTTTKLPSSSSSTPTLPTYHFQECLPKLPVPKLEDTIKKYLVSVDAMIGHPNCNDFDAWEAGRVANAFLKGDGERLQHTLTEHDKQNPGTSYITEPWFDMYLESRLPLPLNYNPFMLFKRDPVPERNDQLLRATNLITSAMRFKHKLDAQALAPEVFYVNDKAKSDTVQKLVKVLPTAGMLRYLPMAYFDAYPLDMSQFGNLLSSTRLPRKGKDQLATYPNSRHVIVLYEGNFYTVTTIEADGRVVSPHVIHKCLKRIRDGDICPASNLSIAHLTTTDRDMWSRNRSHLKYLGNAPSLKLIDSAIFCLVLEPDTDTESASGSVRNFLHGTARWYDKSFSLIVAGNGDTALNFEHAWGDGVAVVRFFNEIFEDSTQNPALTAAKDDSEVDIFDYFDVVKFKLDKDANESMKLAKQSYDTERSRLHAAGGLSSQLNKTFLKKARVSPDGVIQLAIQTGHMYVNGHPAPTYESCSTSAFKHGRTETVRSCTVESMEAARALHRGKQFGRDGDPEFRKQVDTLIRTSCKKHNQLTREAAMGQGFDRHLFALRHTAECLLGEEAPELYNCDVFKLMNSITLSTSTLNSEAIQFGGFAPVTAEGYGIGYGVRDEGVGVNVTSYDRARACELSDAIVMAYEDIYKVLKDSVGDEEEC